MKKALRYLGRLWFLILLSLFVWHAGVSYAGNPVMGAKSTAMGTAFSAIADDPSAIASNPAGITQLTGTNIYGGPTFVIPSTTFKSPSGQREKTEFQIFYPPQLYLTSDAAGKDFVVGLGIFSPFGIGGRKWNSDGLTRYLSVKDQVATVDINPTVAYRVSPSLSVGFGFDAMYSKKEASKKVNQSLLGAADGDAALKADGWGVGFNAGILFTPVERLSFGLAYRSKVKIRHDGHIDLDNIAPPLQSLFGDSGFRTDVSTTMTFPDIITLGAAYRPSNDITLSLEIEEVRWSSFKNADIDVEHKIPQAGFTDTSTNLNWRDSWLFKAGAEYKVSERLSLRGGYAYIQTPVPESTLDPGNPDSNQHNVSVGFGYKTGKNVIDFFYMAGFYTNRKVENNILSGAYNNFVHYTGVSVGHKF